jgi:hypothetical protein
MLWRAFAGVRCLVAADGVKPNGGYFPILIGRSTRFHATSFTMIPQPDTFTSDVIFIL